MMIEPQNPEPKNPEGLIIVFFQGALDCMTRREIETLFDPTKTKSRVIVATEKYPRERMEKHLRSIRLPQEKWPKPSETVDGTPNDNSAFYESLILEHKVMPEHCIVIAGSPPYVMQAHNVGVRGIYFRNTRECSRFLGGDFYNPQSYGKPASLFDTIDEITSRWEPAPPGKEVVRVMGAAGGASVLGVQP
jgi:hypothetical protein